MASTYNRSAIRRSSDVDELYDSDSIYSTSDGEPTQQDLNNRRFTQAINYLTEEGGDDSPATFMDRVNRIDDALIKQLPQEGSAFNPKLYQQTRAMVLDVQRDYEDAAEEESMQMESEDDLPDYHTPLAAAGALYRDDDESPTPTPAARGPPPPSKALHPRRPGSNDHVQREREFKYGGPKNEVENWHRDFPACLPFPETLLMAHWESLKINYDLSRSQEESIVETNVPFHHPLLEPYMNLPQYDSGSRFKLPLVSRDDQNAIAKLENLEKCLNSFNDKDQSEGLTKDYAPRISLPKFKLVANQNHHAVVDQSQIRRALAGTPSKRQTLRLSNTSTIPSKRSSLALIEDCVPQHHSEANEILATRVLVETSLGANAPSETVLANPTVAGDRTGPAVRRITKQVKKALDMQPAAERATPSSGSKLTLARTTTHVQIPKRSRSRSRSRSRKSPPSAYTDSELEPKPKPKLIPVATPPVSSSALGKRKPSSGSQPYTPAKSSIKKNLRNAKKLKTSSTKKVGFVDPMTLEVDKEDPRYPASPVHMPPRAAKEGKAEAAGARAKKTKTKTKSKKIKVGSGTESECEDEDEYEGRMQKKRKGGAGRIAGPRKGVTRSGLEFGI